MRTFVVMYRNFASFFLFVIIAFSGKYYLQIHSTAMGPKTSGSVPIIRS